MLAGIPELRWNEYRKGRIIYDSVKSKFARGSFFWASGRQKEEGYGSLNEFFLPRNLASSQGSILCGADS